MSFFADIWRRIRERYRAVRSPPLKAKMDLGHLPEVHLAEVTTDEDCEILRRLFENNPSPFLTAPKTVAAIRDRISDGIEYYLVYNAHHEVVGARAFRPADAFMLHTVTDYKFRRQGYRLAASFELQRLLASRGVTEIHGNALKNNTRILRGLESDGWTLGPHPDHDELVKVTKRLRPPS